jgi:hypothetical protein
MYPYFFHKVPSQSSIKEKKMKEERGKRKEERGKRKEKYLY